MAKLIDQKSTHALLPNINYSDIPASALGVEQTRIVKVPLKNTFLPQGPWEFIIAQNSKAFLNLKRCWLNVRFKIKTIDDKDPSENLYYEPCQQFAASLINSYHLKIGDQNVYDSTVNHAYKTYIENTLMYSKDVKESRLGISGYFFEDEIDNGSSSGASARRILTKKGSMCELATPISLDIFNQERLFVNFAKVELIAYPNKDSFLIDVHDWKVNSAEIAAKTPVPELKVVIDDVHLLVQEYDLSAGLSLAIENKLAKERIHYPMTSVRMRSFYIEKGRLDSPSNVLFTSHSPKRIVVGLVSANAYNGSQKKSPFNFKPFDLKNIYIELNNRILPTRPYNLDWSSSYTTAYVDMIEGLGLAHSATSNGITPAMYKNGFTFFVFDISPTVHSPELFDVIRQGNVSLKLEFNKPTPDEGIYVIVYAEFDSILSIDSNRTPYIDTSL